METMTLTERLEQSFLDLSINEQQQTSLRGYLNLLKIRDEPTYEHSVRVGLKGIELANFTHIVEPKALYYPGLLHDIGKSLTDPSSLKKTEGFNERDMKEMRKHVLDGYRMLRGIHDFSANVLLYHHWYQGDKSYPKVLPKLNTKFSREKTAVIAYCGRLLALIDFYDAAKFRRNNKFGAEEGTLKTPEQVKTMLLEHNPDQKCLIDALYSAGILK
jgi:response regulator RpfG family c-di-GMP phosphodiesterase